MNKHQVRDRIAQAIGKLKQAAGMIVGDKGIEHEGRIDKLLGSVRARYGDRKDGLKKG